MSGWMDASGFVKQNLLFWKKKYNFLLFHKYKESKVVTQVVTLLKG